MPDANGCSSTPLSVTGTSVITSWVVSNWYATVVGTLTEVLVDKMKLS
jgi:hypothetical protein